MVRKTVAQPLAICRTQSQWCELDGRRRRCCCGCHAVRLLMPIHRCAAAFVIREVSTLLLLRAAYGVCPLLTAHHHRHGSSVGRVVVSGIEHPGGTNRHGMVAHHVVVGVVPGGWPG